MESAWGKVWTSSEIRRQLAGEYSASRAHPRVSLSPRPAGPPQGLCSCSPAPCIHTPRPYGDIADSHPTFWVGALAGKSWARRTLMSGGKGHTYFLSMGFGGSLPWHSIKRQHLLRKQSTFSPSTSHQTGILCPLPGNPQRPALPFSTPSSSSRVSILLPSLQAEPFPLTRRQKPLTLLTGKA